MHPHLSFNSLEILWTLTFAAHLVLLIVLMGRDRVARFPWFSANIALVALRLLASRLLFGKLPQMTLGTIFVVMADLGAFFGIMVVIELGRRAFGQVRRSTWVIGALSLMAVGAVVLWLWGPWPSWKTLTAGSLMSNMQFLQLLAQKASLLVNVENIALGLLVVLFGRRYGAGWHSHTQRILIGLSTASISQLGIQAIWEAIARKASPHSMAEYQHVLDIRDRMFNTNNAVYIAVLIWWIVCLWIDEPGARSTAVAAETAPVEHQPDASTSEELHETDPASDHDVL